MIGQSGIAILHSEVAEKLSQCHCEERFLRRGNLEVFIENRFCGVYPEN